MSPITLVTVAKKSTVLDTYLAHLNWDTLSHELISRSFQLVFLSLLFWGINLVGRAVLTRSFRRYFKVNPTASRAQTISMLSLNVFHYTVLFFWVYAILSTLGVPVGTLIAGAGIFSLALGLGAQGFVSDIVTGVSLLIEQQLDVGDAVKIGEIEGTVTAIGLRTTQVTAADGTLNFIPNRNITIVANKSRNNMRVTIQIPITPQTDLSRVNEVITTVNDHLLTTETNVVGEPHVLGPTTLPDGSLVFQVTLDTLNGTQAAVQAAFLSAYLNALTAAHVVIPTKGVIPPTTTTK